MPPAPISIALIGYGKIAADQHVPAISANPDFELVAVVSGRGAGPPGVPAFTSFDALLASGIAFDATSHCNTPGARRDSAIAALNAGKHCLLEKPPAATMADWEAIAAAQRPGTSLMTGWHSQANAAVTAARDWLADKRITGVALDWCEDVRKWHPGQQWIWDEGGFGVFDPGINGLSIATAILPFQVELAAAKLEIPANRAMPIAARLVGGPAGKPPLLAARFDWRANGDDRWRIVVDSDGGDLVLDGGGTRLFIDGIEQLAHGNDEYPTLYRRFAALITAGQSAIDIAPLALALAALEQGERVNVEPFID